MLNLKKGHMVLIGLGGTGKQSITKVASFLNKMLFYSIELKKNYKEAQWREDLVRLLSLIFSEEENKGITFLVTSNQIKYDSFLEDLNNLINSGEVPNLFPPEQLDELQNSIREHVKKTTGQQLQQKEEIMKAFVEMVKEKLHIVLTFSPVGDTLRTKCR